MWRQTRRVCGCIGARTRLGGDRRRAGAPICGRQASSERVPEACFGIKRVEEIGQVVRVDAGAQERREGRSGRENVEVGERVRSGERRGSEGQVLGRRDCFERYATGQEVGQGERCVRERLLVRSIGQGMTRAVAGGSVPRQREAGCDSLQASIIVRLNGSGTGGGISHVRHLFVVASSSSFILAAGFRAGIAQPARDKAFLFRRLLRVCAARLDASNERLERFLARRSRPLALPRADKAAPARAAVLVQAGLVALFVARTTWQSARSVSDKSGRAGGGRVREQVRQPARLRVFASLSLSPERTAGMYRVQCCSTNVSCLDQAGCCELRAEIRGQV